MPEHYSFFHLPNPRPPPSDDSPLDALTPDEFDACVVEGHPLFQALVETGNAVLGCDRQFETNAAVNEQFETKPGRKSKYPWETLRPQIRQWLHEGKSVREIAKALHMPYTSLQNELYRK